ncbi:hypothetical protein AVEN_199312-1 [Araneus ventricosus]|uniref:Uncharacterized protein n=1 Tax=Araneus ventricosus TaxID=182803 RepID=A0A4Y2H9N5_ARAVE|nr:hypothetical protein AVEN_199312-1 [Araneus ventricosus]
MGRLLLNGLTSGDVLFIESGAGRSSSLCPSIIRIFVVSCLKEEQMRTAHCDAVRVAFVSRSSLWWVFATKIEQDCCA